MHFDDRLATVLRQPVKGRTVARIQFRQLLDLLGTSPSSAQGQRIDSAFLRLAELAGEIQEKERAAMLREPGLRLRNPRLVAQLAESEPQVASAALAAAHLGEMQWLDLIPALPVRARGFLRNRRDFGVRVEALLERLGIADRGLPPGPEPLLLEITEEAASESRERIGAIVRRIEQFRKSRQAAETRAHLGEAPRLPFGEPGADLRSSRIEAFDFATDADGTIAWAEAAVAPMTVGLRIAARDPECPVTSSPALCAAWRRRQPVRGERLEIAGAPAIAGAWVADAAPRFSGETGRFTGYGGRLRRPPPAPPEDEAARLGETDRIRQVLHELRTPVNAIQGFAEVIQQQLFGPTPHEYRALAAAIAGDAARILAGFEDLERLAKLDSGALHPERGACDIGDVVARLATHVEAFLAPRGSRVRLDRDADELLVPLTKPEAERLVWRLLATLAGATVPGEALELRMRLSDGMARVDTRLPASFAGRDDEDLFRTSAPAQAQALSAGMFGSGFALRLAASEARAAGGSLGREQEWLILALPNLTRLGEEHSDQTESFAAECGAS